MNHLYRVIFNKQTGVFCAVSELARSNGKANGVCGTLAKAVRLVLAPLAMAMALVGVAHAAPTDGQVVAGQANIAQIGAVTNINQASQNAVINWQDFGIKAHETVNFHQPSAQAVTLNRVMGNQRSVIDGAMNANGKVFIQNEHGTLIGKNAQINVGSLVATTAKISDDDFMKGNYRFDNAQGSIENLGHISVPQGGVVALIAPIVKNSGTIVAPHGKVLLASADSFSITLPDNVNFSYTLDKGTLQGLVDNKGAIIADGGRIVLTAQGLDTVKKSLIQHTGLIQANTVRNVNGVIELLGDLDNTRLEVAGSLKAEGRGNDKGGLIETSASTVKIDDNAQVSTQADNGKTGTWLIDPKDFVVAPTGGDITGAKVSAGLQNNNVTLKSRDGAKEGNGDVIVNDEIRWDKNTLTLNADHDIHINANLNGTGSAKLALEYGQGSEYGTYKVMVDGKETTKDNDYHIQKDTPLAQRTVKINLPEGKNFSIKKGTFKGPFDRTQFFDVIHKMPEIQQDQKNNWYGYFRGENNQARVNIAIGGDIDVGYTKNHQGFGGWEIRRTDGSYGISPDLTLHGLGHKIDGLHLDVQAQGDPRVGLIQDFTPNSSVTNKEKRVRDLGVTNVDIRTDGGYRVYTGAIAGYGGNIADSYATGKIYSNSKNSPVGGLLGHGSTITNSYANVDVQAVADGAIAGGLGGNVRIIENSYATGDVSTTGYDGNAGGLVGNGGNIYNSYATGDVSTTGYDGNAGGLVGNGGNIYNSYATGDIQTAHAQADAGGLVGSGNYIYNSYATGDVSTAGRSSHAGGLVGRGDHIYNSYATGDVSTAGEGNAGGLLGVGHTIDNSYADNQVSVVSQESAQGGLIGYYSHYNYASNNSFFNNTNRKGLQAIGSQIESSQPLKVANVTGKSEDELKQKATFTDWDFDKIWYINEGEMPKLHTHKKGTVVITPKTDLAINANHLSKVYDGKAVEDEAQLKQIAKDNGFEDVVAISGLKNGDDLSSLGTLSYDGTWKNAKDANTYTIVPKGLAGGQDYEIKYGEGSLTINKRPVNIIGTKVYDGTDVVLDSNLRLNNIVAGDDVSLKAGTQGKIADKNVGIHKINDPDTLVIIGTNANNYVANLQNVQVTPKALNIAVSKDFDDSPTFKAGFTATNLIGSDKADVVGTATVADKKVGTYQDFVSASLMSNNRNYVYTQGTSAVNAVIKAVSQPVPPTTTNPTPQPVTPSPVPVVPQPTTPTPIVPQPVQPQPTIPTPTVPQPSTPATPVTTPQPVVPVQPSPVPVVPQPVQSTPVQTQPVQTVPVQTQPVVSIPIVPTPSPKNDSSTLPLGTMSNTGGKDTTQTSDYKYLNISKKQPEITGELKLVYQEQVSKTVQPKVYGPEKPAELQKAEAIKIVEHKETFDYLKYSKEKVPDWIPFVGGIPLNSNGFLIKNPKETHYTDGSIKFDIPVFNKMKASLEVQVYDAKGNLIDSQIVEPNYHKTSVTSHMTHTWGGMIDDAQGKGKTGRTHTKQTDISVTVPKGGRVKFTYNSKKAKLNNFVEPVTELINHILPQFEEGSKTKGWKKMTVMFLVDEFLNEYQKQLLNSAVKGDIDNPSILIETFINTISSIDITELPIKFANFYASIENKSYSGQQYSLAYGPHLVPEILNGFIEFKTGVMKIAETGAVGLNFLTAQNNFNNNLSSYDVVLKSSQ